jgi:hypothetical protein
MKHSLRKRSLEESQLPNFLSDDSDFQQKYQNVANFEFLPVKLPKKKKSKNCLVMSQGFEGLINGSENNVDGTRNYAIFDLKSRNLFLVIKKIFTECLVSVGDIGKLNEIDKKIMISLFNRKFKMTLS